MEWGVWSHRDRQPMCRLALKPRWSLNQGERHIFFYGPHHMRHDQEMASGHEVSFAQDAGPEAPWWTRCAGTRNPYILDKTWSQEDPTHPVRPFSAPGAIQTIWAGPGGTKRVPRGKTEFKPNGGGHSLVLLCGSCDYGKCGEHVSLILTFSFDESEAFIMLSRTKWAWPEANVVFTLQMWEV